MKTRVLIGLLVLLLPSAFAYRFSELRCTELRSRVAASIQAIEKSAPLAELKIAEIEQAFLEIPRSGVSADDTLELVFMLGAWRRRLKLSLLEQGRNGDEHAIEGLKDLKIVLTASDVQGLKDGKLPYDALKELVRKRGDISAQAQTLIDPAVKDAMVQNGVGTLKPFKYPFVPVVGTGFGADRWIDESDQQRSLSDYKFISESEIEYRGIRFQPGDVLLTNHNNIPDGLINSFVSPRWMLTHSSLFVLPERNGIKIPSVLEVHQQGLRLVPLNHYINNTMATYVEVYRRAKIERGWVKKINKVSLNLLRKHWGYDYRTRLVGDKGEMLGERNCVQCSTMVDMAFKRAGTNLKFSPSVVNPQMQETLEQVEDPFEFFLNPGDLMRSPHLKITGVIDNDKMPVLVASQLVYGTPGVPNTVSNLLTTKSIDFTKLPFFTRPLEDLATAVRDKKIGTEVFIRALGWEHRDQFPDLPPKVIGVMAAITLLDLKAVNQLKDNPILYEALDSPQAFSFHDLENSEQMGELKAELLKNHQPLFKKKNGPNEGSWLNGRRLMGGAEGAMFNWLTHIWQEPLVWSAELLEMWMQQDPLEDDEPGWGQMAGTASAHQWPFMAAWGVMTGGTRWAEKRWLEVNYGNLLERDAIKINPKEHVLVVNWGNERELELGRVAIWQRYNKMGDVSDAAKDSKWITDSPLSVLEVGAGEDLQTAIRNHIELTGGSFDRVEVFLGAKVGRDASRMRVAWEKLKDVLRGHPAAKLAPARIAAREVVVLPVSRRWDMAHIENVLGETFLRNGGRMQTVNRFVRLPSQDGRVRAWFKLAKGTASVLSGFYHLRTGVRLARAAYQDIREKRPIREMVSDEPVAAQLGCPFDALVKPSTARARDIIGRRAFDTLLQQIR